MPAIIHSADSILNDPTVLNSSFGFIDESSFEITFSLISLSFPTDGPLQVIQNFVSKMNHEVQKM